MTKTRLFTVVSITASCFAVWLYIVTQTQPNRQDTFLFILFYTTFIVWVGSAIAMLLYRIRVAKSNRQVIYAYVKPSIRQGFIISSTLATLLFLQMIHVISLWETSLVIIVAILFEMALRQSSYTGNI